MRTLLAAFIALLFVSQVAAADDPVKECRLAADPTVPLSRLNGPAAVEKCRLAVELKPKLDVVRFYYARALEADGEPELASEQYQVAAEAGHVKSAVMLGLTALRGTTGVVDKAKAAYWLGLAAERHNPEAQLMLADMYVSGEGVARDYQRAYDWYERVKKGDGYGAARWAMAQLCLGPLAETESNRCGVRLQDGIQSGYHARLREAAEWDYPPALALYERKGWKTSGQQRAEQDAKDRETLAAFLTVGAGLLYLLSQSDAPPATQQQPTHGGPTCESAQEIYAWSGDTNYMRHWC